MSEFARWKYKCRKCGKVFVGAGGSWASMPVELAHAIMGDGTVRMVSSHICGDGGTGITDLVGVDKECK